MAISAYVGLPGSGKSYGVVENVILPAFKKGQKVFTNIPMRTDHCLEVYGAKVVQFDIKDIIDNPDWWTETFEAGSLLVIDEVWRLWPAGLNINKARMQDKEFLAEHRHLVNQDTKSSTNIALVTQDLAQMSNFVKVLVDKTFRSVKLDAVGAKKRFRVDVYQGEVSGTNPPDKKKLNSLFYKYKTEVFDCYVSHTKSDVAGDESRSDERFNLLKSTKLKVLMFLILAPILLVFFGKSKVEDDIGLTPSTIVEDQNVLEVKNQVLEVKKQSRFKFLSIQESIYISFNMGMFPNIRYLITVETDDIYHAVFDESQLSLMDYQLIPISTCAVRITGSDFDQVVLCQKEGQQRGAIEKSVGSASF
jgi:zona occludens toxin